eukprot:XP_004911451.1 PREDICTED: uncharacterized protein LOC101735191 [Xenopus tropicalis]
MTEGEISLLSRGLSFVPSSQPDTFNTLVDIYKFQRKLKLKEHFRNSSPTVQPQFKGKSQFEPPNTPPTVRTFGKVLSLEAKQTGKTSSMHPNLSPAERQAIRSLQNDRNLVIRPADKGGSIVLLDYAYYREEIRRQLSDLNTYRALNGDPTIKFKNELDHYLFQALNAGWITQDTYNFLLTEFPRTPIIYTLPKIHKSLSAPPGRPIISAVGSLYQPISTYIDSFLQPLVKTMTSYTQDSTHVIRKLKELGDISDSHILVTMDVTSLYTVIPHDQGISSVRRALATSEGKNVPTEFLLHLLELTLTRNFFRFEKDFFLQLSGTAMGSALAPSYANLYMADFESTHLLPLLHKSISVYFRYIDDLFLIWTEDGGVGTRLFRKPTDRNSILHASSYHPPATIKGIPYSQFLRVIRNNSSPDTARIQLQDMFDRFLERGYKEQLLLTQLQRALTHTQDTLLNKDCTRDAQPAPLIFTTTFSSTSRALSESITKNWPMVNQDESLSLYHASKPVIGYKRGNSLRDLLVTTDFKNYDGKQKDWLSSYKKLGCYKCPDCVTCRCLLCGPDFPHPHTGKRYKILHRLGCLSTFVVYIITCPCGLYYVGKTVTTLRERIGNHRSAISRALKEGESIQPVARHFVNMRHPLPTFKCMAINHQPPLTRGGNRDLALLRRESRWIHKLDCVAPRGLNEILPLGCFI